MSDDVCGGLHWKDKLAAEAVAKMLNVYDDADTQIKHDTLKFVKQEDDYYKVVARKTFTVQGVEIKKGTVGGVVECPALLLDNVWINDSSRVVGVSSLSDTLVIDSMLYNVLSNNSTVEKSNISKALVKNSQLKSCIMDRVLVKDSNQSSVSIIDCVMDGCTNQLNLKFACINNYYCKHYNQDKVVYLSTLNAGLQNFVSVAGLFNNSRAGDINYAVCRSVTGKTVFVTASGNYLEDEKDEMLEKLNNEVRAEQTEKVLDGLAFALRQKHYKDSLASAEKLGDKHKEVFGTPMLYWSKSTYSYLLANSKFVEQMLLTYKLQAIVATI